MGRITDLVEQVASENSNLSSTLRQTKILAYELGIKEISQWVDQELNGYAEDDSQSVPVYRRFPTHSLGTYVDPARRITRYPIPIHVFPEEMREHFSRSVIHLSIGSIEMMAADKDGTLRSSYTSEQLSTLNYYIEKTYGAQVGFIDAWREISDSILTSIIENVRNRLLGFLLNLRDEYPELDIEHPKPTEQQQEDAKQMFKAEIHGQTVYINQGQEITQTVISAINGVDDLVEHVKSLGVPDNELEALREAIEKDEEEGSNEERELGKHVRGWIGNFTANAAGGAVINNLPVIIEAIQKVVGG